MKEQIINLIIGDNHRYECNNPYCSNPYSNGPGECCLGHYREKVDIFHVSAERLSDKIMKLIKDGEFNGATK